MKEFTQEDFENIKIVFGYYFDAGLNINLDFESQEEYKNHLKRKQSIENTYDLIVNTYLRSVIK